MSVPIIRQDTALAATRAPGHTIQELKAMADQVVQSGLAPDGWSPEKLTVVMLKGQEIGLRPMESMESLYVVGGKVGNMTHQLVNLLRDAGHDYSIDESTMEQCTVTIYRADGKRHRHTVTFKECADARWNQNWDKQTSSWKVKPQWQGGGQRTMLTYRTISQAIKLYCSEVLHRRIGDQPARAQIAAPVDLAELWYRYTRELIESEGADAVIRLVSSLAESTEDSRDMIGEATGDGIIDAEFFEEEDDQEPVEAAVVTPPPPPGAPPADKPTRPYPPELVREAIASRAKKGAQEIAAQGVRGATVGALEALFVNASKESKAHMRHQLGQYLLGKGTSNEWTHGECQALLQWAQTRQDDGEQVPTEKACLEAAAIIRSLDSQGQMEIPL